MVQVIIWKLERLTTQYNGLKRKGIHNMKVVRVKRTIGGIEHKIPYVIMSKREKEKWEYDAEGFYKLTFSDLDFRVEPFEMGNIELENNCWLVSYNVITWV